jgi:Zn-dependent peptidase ImmA (M78 family)
MRNCVGTRPWRCAGGFKKEANEYARELRAELGLAPHDPLCPWKLAQHIEIPVVALSELRRSIPEAVAYLMKTEQSIFSAATLFHGRKRLIVHNDAHHRSRQAANLAHELSHGILGHPPTTPFNDWGCRNIDKSLEDEANWLGPALLVSEEAALFVVKQGIPMTVAADRYGVSQKLITMRIGVTGARKRMARRDQLLKSTALR